MRLEEAAGLADELIELLGPYCDRIEVAGGIRRGKAEPHDIELVAKPKFEDATLGFFQPLMTDILKPKLEGLLHDGGWNLTQTLHAGDPDKAGKRAPSGPKYYRLKYRGQKLDLFVVLPPAQWGVVFAIRTGDADYSHWLVQQGWKDGIKFVDGHMEQRGTAIKTPEEIDVFNALSLDISDPFSRNLFTAREQEQTAKPQGGAGT